MHDQGMAMPPPNPGTSNYRIVVNEATSTAMPLEVQNMGLDSVWNDVSRLHVVKRGLVKGCNALGNVVA